MISVIIPTHNEGEYLELVLHSLLNQDTESYYELIVVNDGSTDATSEILANFNTEKVRTISFEDQRGVVEARNAGIEAAQGDILIFSVGDAVVSKDYLSEYEELLSRENCDGIVGPTKIDIPYNGDLFLRYLNRKRSPAEFTNTPLPPGYVTFTNLGMHRENLEQAGLFDTSFQGYGGHEQDMAHRLIAENGGQFYYSAEVATQRQQYRSFPDTLEKFRHFGRANLPMLLRKYPQYKRHYKVTFYDAAPGLTSLGVKMLDGLLRFLIPVNNENHIGGWLKIKPRFVQHGFIKVALGVALLRGYVKGRH